jgi:hypothetical protein
MPMVLEKGVSNCGKGVGKGIYEDIASQEQSKVEAKPNIASLSNLRWGSSQKGGPARREMEGTHSDNLIQLEGAHFAAVDGGAGPF